MLWPVLYMLVAARALLLLAVGGPVTQVSLHVLLCVACNTPDTITAIALSEL